MEEIKGKVTNFKRNDKVNVNGLVFKKKVVAEALEFFGDVTNYLEVDIELNVALGFLNNLSVGTSIISELSERKGDIIDVIQVEVLPLYETEILGNEKNLASYNEIKEEVREYLKREMENGRHVTGLLKKVIDGFGRMDLNDITTIIQKVSANVGAQGKDKTLEEKRESLEADPSIQALINKYSNKTETSK